MKSFVVAALIGTSGLIFGSTVAGATNLIVNGDFSAGNTGFTSQYTYAATVYNQGLYTIGVQPEYNYNIYWGTEANFAPPAGATSPEMMLINGGSVASNIVWSEADIAVQPNTTYYFSAQIANPYSQNPAVLDFSVNGAALGSSFTAGNAVGKWAPFFATWDSGSNTQATFSLVDTNTVAAGNDFALDLISLSTNSPGGTSVGGDPVPTSGVPEPSQWALLIVGLGILGATSRRRQKVFA